MDDVVREVPCALLKASIGTEILIANELLELAEAGDTPCASFGDGIFTMHALDGDVSFGVRGFNRRANAWAAHR